MNESPINPIPPVVIALFLLIVGVELLLWAGQQGIIGGPGAVGWRLGALTRYGFSTDVARKMWEIGHYPTEHVMRFVTYPFVHGGFTQAAFAAVMLLALGKMVGEVFSAPAVVVVFIGSAIVGAFAMAVFARPGSWLIGAFPGVYGLIGAFTWLVWLRLTHMGSNPARAFTLIGVLLGLQLVFGVFFGADDSWIADLAGFGAGFMLCFVVSPGGWKRLLDRLRQR